MPESTETAGRSLTDVITQDEAAELLGLGDQGTFAKVAKKHDIPKLPWGRALYLRGTIEAFKRKVLADQVAKFLEQVDPADQPSVPPFENDRSRPFTIGRAS